MVEILTRDTGFFTVQAFVPGVPLFRVAAHGCDVYVFRAPVDGTWCELREVSRPWWGRRTAPPEIIAMVRSAFPELAG